MSFNYAIFEKRAYRIIFTIAIVAGISSRSIYNIIKDNGQNFQIHPFATLLGGFLPTAVCGLVLYWWISKMASKHSQSKAEMVESPVHLRSITKRRPIYFALAGSLVVAPFALWLFTSINSEEPSKLIAIPSPSDFIEGSSLSAYIKAIASAGLPPNSKLIGSYYQPDALSEILKTGYAAPSPFGKALIQFDGNSVSEADQYLKKLVMNAKRDESKTFDLNDPDIARILDGYKGATKKINPSIAISINGMVSLGSIAETDTYYARSLISVFDWTNGAQTVKLPFVSAVSWMRVGKQVIQFSMTYPFDGKESILATNATLINWLKAIETNR